MKMTSLHLYRTSIEGTNLNGLTFSKVLKYKNEFIFLAINNANGEHIVVKLIDKKALCEDFKLMHDARKALSFQSRACHPNIMPQTLLCETEEQILVTMPFAERGNIDEMLILESQVPIELHLPEPVLCNIVRSLFAGIYYCHVHSISHNNITCSNVLIDDDFNAYLTGFHYHTFAESQQITESKISPLYRAPEMYETDVTEYFCFEADMWAAGVVIYKLVYHEYPFQPGEFTMDILPLEPVGVDSLIVKLLEVDPKKRLNILEACLDDWVNIDCEENLLTYANRLLEQSGCEELFKEEINNNTHTWVFCENYLQSTECEVNMFQLCVEEAKEEQDKEESNEKYENKENYKEPEDEEKNNEHGEDKEAEKDKILQLNINLLIDTTPILREIAQCFVGFKNENTKDPWLWLKNYLKNACAGDAEKFEGSLKFEEEQNKEEKNEEDDEKAEADEAQHKLAEYKKEEYAEAEDNYYNNYLQSVNLKGISIKESFQELYELLERDLPHTEESFQELYELLERDLQNDDESFQLEYDESKVSMIVTT